MNLPCCKTEAGRTASAVTQHPIQLWGLRSPFLEAVHKGQHDDLQNKLIPMLFTNPELSKGQQDSQAPQMWQQMVLCISKEPGQIPVPSHKAAWSWKGATSPSSLPGAEATQAWAPESITVKTKSMSHRQVLQTNQIGKVQL